MDKQSLAKTTKDILNKYNIKLNKNLGQNYLIDRNKRDQIIDFGNITILNTNLVYLLIHIVFTTQQEDANVCVEQILFHIVRMQLCRP